MAVTRKGAVATRRARLSVYLPALIVFAAMAILAYGPPPTPTRLFTVGVLSAALIAAVTEWRLAHDLKARESTRDALYRTAGGDLTLSRKELDRSGDSELSNALHGLLVEMERILASFARLAGAVSGVARELTTRSRDLSQAVVLQTTRAEETAASIERTDAAIGSLRGSMEDLAGAAENAGASLHEMSAAIGQVSQSAQGLRAFIDDTAKALEGMLGSLDEVAVSVEELSRLAGETARATAVLKETTEETDRQTRTAARLAERVSAAATGGKGSVSGTAEGMTAIRDSVSGATEAAVALGERSQRIGEILHVIEDIAGETNLLALNASIIAAQYGEHGKAFSVVAGDIRDLSDRTALSTEEVRELVLAVRTGVEDVQRLLRIARQRADQGVDLARSSDDALSDIQRLATESRRASEGIAAAAAQQALEIGRVSEATARVSEEVERISGATRDQVETARAVSMRGERVRQSADQLSRAMSEQATGSQTLLTSMERVTSTVDAIAEATSTLADGSAAVVRSMEGTRRGTAQIAFGATAMFQTAQALEQESLMLKERSSVFRLPDPIPGGRVRAALRYVDTEEFDPAFAFSIPLTVLAKTWGETLVQFADGTRILPQLAERWEVDPTGTHYTFHLRRGVLFHEGGTLTAAEVKASFERYLSPELDAPLASWFEPISGVPDYRAGQTPRVAGIEAPDAGTVRFHLERPVPFFLALMTLPDVTIVPPSLVASRAKAKLTPSGTGAFIPREIRFGKVARFDRFDGYRDRAQVALDGVDLDLTEDSEAGVYQRLLDGRLDVVWDIPYPEAAKLMADPVTRPYIDSTTQLHTSFLVLRCDRPPLDDVRIRRALNHAIDRHKLNERCFSGLTVLASSILPPHLLGHDPNLRPLRHDPERARELLAEAGMSSGLTLTTWLSPRDAQDPANPIPYVAADLEKVGVKVVTEVLSGEEMTARKKRGEFFNFRLQRWFADFPDPDNFFSSLFYSKTEDVADFGYQSAAVDRLVEKGARATDGKEREAIYRELDRLIQADAPAVFLFHNRGFVVHRPALRGVRAYLLPPPVRWTDLSFER